MNTLQLASLLMLIAVVSACETVCSYGAGDGFGYCDYSCNTDSGGHNSASDYTYNFAAALRGNGYDCHVEGSAESTVHCNSMNNCRSHSWKAGNDC
ncbi:uncharacterized protein VTP21DRAFT_2905 [Calcarisporiella thermophila]|uniref:uncharacterized protein n=1 Tax=Calcarisporiella thermophila TaxID=911321 RepID=UPI003743F79E